jgi:hypothetical protein
MSEMNIPGDFKDGVRDEDRNDATPPSDPGLPGPVVRLDASRNRTRPASKATTETLASGLSDEDLWMLIRRFNKVSYYVLPVDRQY